MPRKTARRSTARRTTARRSARRSARRTTARRSARRTTARRTTARRSKARRTTARRSKARRTTARRSKKNRKGRVDAVSNILSAAYGIKRKGSKKGRVEKRNTQDDIDSFLGGIETSGSYGLKEIFKGDDKGNRVDKKGPHKKRKPTPPRIPRNVRGKKVKTVETTGPLDPAAIKGNKVIAKKVKKEKKTKRRTTVKASAWIDHVKSFYREKKKVDPNYKYKNALKDAKATYKKK